MTDQAALTRVLREFARLLVNDYEISDALHDLVDGVTEVLGITGAGVSLADDGNVHFATAVSEPISMLERAQEETQAGPCVEAHRSGREVLVPDLFDGPPRWPLVIRAASRAGIVAVAGIPMRLNDAKVGALNLYHNARRDWDEEELGAARLLADVTTGHLANAARLDRIRHTAEQLRTALDTRVIIEQAKGVLAGERNITVDAAFELLRSHARAHNSSLRSVAQAVVNLRLRP